MPSAVHAGSLTACLGATVIWKVRDARDRHWAAHPGEQYAASFMPLPLAKVLCLTLLELWALVPEREYIASTGMTLLVVRVGCRGWLVGWLVGCGCTLCSIMQPAW